jgi:hypothetical protein
VSGRVGPDARRRDLTAMLILLAGAAVAMYGYLELHVMATRPIARVTGEQAIQRAFSYTDVMYVGLGIMGVGVCVVIWSAWRYHRRTDPSA